MNGEREIEGEELPDRVTYIQQSGVKDREGERERERDRQTDREERERERGI